MSVWLRAQLVAYDQIREHDEMKLRIAMVKARGPL